ncbi:MAG: DEAD/DEAH box helicase [Ignavibacteriaceae bacterium]
MNRNVNLIRNRLSLRPPQEESLTILSSLVEKLSLRKNSFPNEEEKQLYLSTELEKVKSTYSTCTDFERTFPSVCFALATGVGKTRLMGSFIAYLYLEKGIKNFFVLSPNLTVYNKLIEDFSNTTSPKYVFQGIGEFVTNQPRIITGDNYDQISQTKLFESDIHINVFNISKINAETRGGNIPRIKRLSEYLGESYFNYLSNLDDLVLLMDESHHYRADRGMEVLNELSPIIGLEVTATPQVERAGRTAKFKNVVYEYSLAKAIQDGFVKEPAVATRKDFIPSQYSLDELDRIKLEDGIRIHEATKVELYKYSLDAKVRLVKPFVLVVAKDTEHAGRLKDLIISQSFFNGNYVDKVMEIHSNQSGEEKEENIAKLLSLESYDNKIEIVIHVNMLKEGWDVTNLYTIIPLRTAASMTLREQTIGRGLRLPYGNRTGVDKVDKLTIVAHDKFQEIIDEANKPDSIIKQQNIIIIDEQELNQSKEVVVSTSITQQKYEEQKKQIETILEPEQKQKATITLEVTRLINEVLPELNKEKDVKNISDLKREDIQKIALEMVKEKIYSDPQQNMFANDLIKEAQQRYEAVVEEFTENIIEIPRITIQPSSESKSGFKNFDLDTIALNYQPVSEEILIKKLREQENDTETLKGGGKIILDTPANLIVNELINYSEIDYDSQSGILFKLADQAIEKFKTYLDQEGLINVVQYNKREIASFIFNQLIEHFYLEAPEFEKPVIDVKSFTRIEDHNYTKFTQDSIRDFKETITPTSAIPTKIFTGFKKACHTLYKFDSKAEKDFSIILEQDSQVKKWLRPAPNQFKIYWCHNSKQYRPDFVAETDETIYLIEIKKESDIDDTEVQEKATAAKEYCKYASEYNSQHGNKPWKYILIPHNVVVLNMSFSSLVNNYM